MAKVTLAKQVEAIQFRLGNPLPDGFFMCQPEINWSAGRKYVYFTYANLLGAHGHWLGVDRLDKQPDGQGGLGGWVGYTPKDGGPEYFREHLSFAFWSIKSEASVKRDHRAVFLDPDDAEQMQLWHDYASAERFPNPIPRMAEFRLMSGSYGRGYRPYYLKDGDWLLNDRVPAPHDSDSAPYRVVSDAEFKVLQAA